MKVGKTPSDPESRVPGSWQDLGHFSRNFGAIKNRIECDRKGDINAISCNKNKPVRRLVGDERAGENRCA